MSHVESRARSEQSSHRCRAGKCIHRRGAAMSLRARASIAAPGQIPWAPPSPRSCDRSDARAMSCISARSRANAPQMNRAVSSASSPSDSVGIRPLRLSNHCAAANASVNAPSGSPCPPNKPLSPGSESSILFADSPNGCGRPPASEASVSPHVLKF
eukprot:1325979-Prymnesium_polylepis.3